MNTFRASEIVDYMHRQTSCVYDVAKQAFGEDDQSHRNLGRDTTENLFTMERLLKFRTYPKAFGDTKPSHGDVPHLRSRLFSKTCPSHAVIARSTKKDIRSAVESLRVLVNMSSLNAVNWQACDGVKPGINAILFWRCLLKNVAWDTYWDTH